MRRGLVSGKFMPLHRGHQLLIESALARVDDLTVLVYDTPVAGSYTPMPIEKRLDWIGHLYPDVHAILAVSDPYADQPGHEGSLYAKRYAEQISFLGSFDYVFTSEPDYSAWAHDLGAKHVLVDVARDLLPISGTKIREDLFSHRGWIDPYVYRSLIQKVVFVGSESTGKSTLCEALADHYDTQWVHEYGRELWTEQNGGSFYDHLKMGLNQHRREDAMALNSRHFLFCDTNAWITKQWSLYAYNTVDVRLDKLVRETNNDYAWFLCDNDIPWVQDPDGMRQLGDGQAERFQQQIISALDQDAISYTVVSGPLEQRIMTVQSELIRRFSLTGYAPELAS